MSHTITRRAALAAAFVVPAATALAQAPGP